MRSFLKFTFDVLRRMNHAQDAERRPVEVVINPVLGKAIDPHPPPPSSIRRSVFVTHLRKFREALNRLLDSGSEPESDFGVALEPPIPNFVEISGSIRRSDDGDAHALNKSGRA